MYGKSSGKPRPSISPKEKHQAARATAAKLKKWQQTISKTDDTGLDPWQERALAALLAGDNLVIDAPTSAGKTRVVEAYLDTCKAIPRFRACYTCPIKSLSNDKMKDFRKRYGAELVGINTGDVKENKDGFVVVATLESYRNSLLGIDPDQTRDLVVFDEYHYLQDAERGGAWEEALILTPKKCQLILMSASLSNAYEFADWLEFLTGRKTTLIQELERPVPLVNLIWSQGSWLEASTLPKKVLKPSSRKAHFLSQRAAINRLKALLPLGLTPCLVYVGKRLDCEVLAKSLSESLGPLPEAEALTQHIAELDAETQFLTYLPPNLRTLVERYGVAYHHSGLVPLARWGIEALLKAGDLRFCTATMGLSLGINFSVKSIMLRDLLRPGPSGPVPYSNSDVLQMTGRAGRRGIDQVGFTCWPNFEAYNGYFRTYRESCDSSLRHDPSTFLCLVGQGYSLAEIEDFYEKSFYTYQQNRRGDWSLIRRDSLQADLKKGKLPCQNPAHEFSAFHRRESTLCKNCKLRKSCHRRLKFYLRKPLAQLQLHLHNIGALEESGLSDYGEVAKYFPQNGGLLIAKLIGRLDINNIVKLMAALSLAKHKKPTLPPDYRLDIEVETLLFSLYPRDLFLDLYEQRYGSWQFREFNPSAAYLLETWLKADSWDVYSQQVCNSKFAPGDLAHLLYRCASYLLPLRQVLGHEEPSKIHNRILRSPLERLAF